MHADPEGFAAGLREHLRLARSGAEPGLAEPSVTLSVGEIDVLTCWRRWPASTLARALPGSQLNLLWISAGELASMRSVPRRLRPTIRP
jgi:hypothetical protein